MAEFLIDNRESRSLKEKGDIVCVRPDGYLWSDSEKPKVIKVPSISYANAVKYEQPVYDDIESKNPILIRHRKYKISDTLFNGNTLDSNKIKSFKITDIITKT